MPEMKTLGGYEVVDAKAREDIEGLQEAIENIDIPEVDLTSYATKSEIPIKVSQLQNDSNFITREEVPNPDLSEYITENELLAKGYLTEHQSLDGYATEAYVNNHKATAYTLHIPETVDSKITDPETIEFFNSFKNGVRLTGYVGNVMLTTAVVLGTGNLFFKYDTPYDDGYSYASIEVRPDGNGNWFVAGFSKTDTKIPKTTKDLTNTANFVTKDYVDSAIAALRAELTGGAE